MLSKLLEDSPRLCETEFSGSFWKVGLLCLFSRPDDHWIWWQALFAWVRTGMEYAWSFSERGCWHQLENVHMTLLLMYKKDFTVQCLWWHYNVLFYSPKSIVNTISLLFLQWKFEYECWIIVYEKCVMMIIYNEHLTSQAKSPHLSCQPGRPVVVDHSSSWIYKKQHLQGRQNTALALPILATTAAAFHISARP